MQIRRETPATNRTSTSSTAPGTAAARTRRTGPAGFTLVELLVVITLIVILISILLPALSGVKNSARDATSRTTMATVQAAIQSFRTENNRLPGAFNGQQMGSTQNSNVGLTGMQNAILELSGGIIANSADADFTITLGGEDVNVRLADIGSKDGPAYLELGGNDFQYVKGQRSNLVIDQGAANERFIPSVNDAYGMPILLWAKNELAGSLPALAGVNSNGPQRALFYYQSNTGHTTSSALGNRAPVNQNTYSLLGGVAGAAINATPPTMAAIVGHPGFPTADNPPRPSVARGDIIMQSAGADRVYLNKEADENGVPSFLAAQYRPSDGAPGASFADGVQFIDDFDDVIVGGG